MAKPGSREFTDSMRLQLREMIRASNNLLLMLEALIKSRLCGLEQAALLEQLYARQFKELVDTQKENDTLKSEIEQLKDKVAKMEKERVDDMLIWLSSECKAS